MNKGDKVIIRKDLIVDNFYGGLRFHNGMSRYKGKETEILCNPHYNKNAYRISGDEGYDWSKEMFER